MMQNVGLDGRYTATETKTIPPAVFQKLAGGKNAVKF